MTLAVLGSLAACGTTTPSSTGTTTTVGRSSSSTTSAVASQPATAVWPFAAGSTRYTDPVEAARSFAEAYLGFVNPVIGSFQEGDSRSGEVAVQTSGNGPVTTVLVRMLTPDNSWWVLGASTPSLQLQTPKTLALVTSPVTVSGQSTAFEATVNVQLRQDGTLVPLKEDIVMGGSNGTMGPFSKSLVFTTPSSKSGAVVLKTLSAKDGNTSEASVIRVNFSP